MNKLLTYFFQILSAIAILLCFLAYLAPEINPAFFGGLTFLGTAFPWILLGNVLLLLFWAWRLNRFALYHAGIIAVGWYYVTGFLGLDFGKNPIPPQAIHIATHNIGHLWNGDMTDAQYRSLAKKYAAFWIQHGKPDILCTQETRARFYKILAREMNYPYTFNLKKGTVILSKFPLANGGEVPFEDTENSTLWVDVTANRKKFRVYNVHLQSNRVTNVTQNVLEKGDLNDEKTWSDIKKVVKKVDNATRIRAEQAQQLRAHIEACKIPILVCGDFNDTPNSYVYKIIAAGMTDTFREKGLGFGTTFAGALPLLRIDYILAGPNFPVYHCYVVKGNYSDHFPVVAVLGNN